MREAGVARSSRVRRTPQPSWAVLPDRELLQVRLKELHVSVAGTPLEDCLDDLNDELKAQRLNVKAHGWISDEWFSPDNTPGIAFPFYLAHPRLVRLERKMVGEVEGGGRRECMQILRHEAGHVIQHAFSLHRRHRWQELFGHSSEHYPEYYRPNPASKDYVQHLRRWYAQSHPDEDFAETFAVWLTPRSNWQKRFADWPALQKLHYVDELMAEIADKKPTFTSRIEIDPINKLNKTLGEHYKKKLALYAVDTPTTFDRALQRIFSADARAGVPAASMFIKRNRAAIKKLAPKWGRENGFTLDAALDDIIDRCRILKLRASGSQSQLRQSLAALLNSRRVHSLYTASARQWFAL
jgi:Putative zinc-binding metallo-peptidase